MSSLSADQGGISFKVLFWVLLLSVVVHVVVKIVPVYIDAERMKDEMAIKARLAQTLRDEEILVDLEKKAKDLELPIGPDGFKLVRDDEHHQMKISAKWDVTVHLFFDFYPPYTTKTYHFEPNIEESYSRRF